ncbi:MAG TPA: DUF1501 domain-containing protein [Kineosporiaceae bacterium]
MPASHPVAPRGVRRRALLGAGAGAVAGAGVGVAVPAVAPAGLGLAARAEAAAAVDTLVVLSLRGGADGLSMIPPIADDAYARARPTLAVPASAAHRLDDTFGLHPALAPLVPLWEAGRLAAVHAVGQPTPTRSHLDAVTAQESAAPSSTAGTATGWVDRLVGVVADASPTTATQVGDPLLPASMAGPHDNLAMRGLDAMSIAVSETIVPVRGWQEAVDLLDAGRTDDPLIPTLEVAARLGALPPVTSAAEAGYPATALGTALHDVARLVRAGVGVRVATVEDAGWDLHAGVGDPRSGPLSSKLDLLARALVAFSKDLGPELDRVVLVTLTEFGRRVAENGSGGLDHGLGSAMLVLGGHVVGGKVHGTWPGLDDGDLVDGALAATTDYRSVLAEILTRRCGVTATGTVFPGFTPAALGLVQAR